MCRSLGVTVAGHLARCCAHRLAWSGCFPAQMELSYHCRRFTSRAGLAYLMDLSTDGAQCLRLPAAFAAVAQRCAAEGSVEGAAAILAFADEGAWTFLSFAVCMGCISRQLAHAFGATLPGPLLQVAARALPLWRKPSALRWPARRGPPSWVAWQRAGRRVCAMPSASMVRPGSNGCRASAAGGCAAARRCHTRRSVGARLALLVHA